MFDPVMESVVILSLGNLSRRLTLGQGMYPSLLSDLFAARSFTSFDKPEQSSQCPSESFLGCCFAVGYSSRYCLQQGVSGDFLPISEKASQLASDPPSCLMANIIVHPHSQAALAGILELILVIALDHGKERF